MTAEDILSDLSSSLAKTCKRCDEKKSISNFRGRHAWCTQCRNQDNRKRYAVNIDKEHVRGAEARRKNPSVGTERQREWYRKNPEKARAYAVAYRSANLEKCRATDNAWVAANPEKVKEKTKRWVLGHHDKVIARNAKRRASKRGAVPMWADKEQINSVYAAAKRLSMKFGTMFEVDHIVPLQSDIVCGLHTWENLQLLTSEENSSKNNRHWPDMP